MAARQRTWSDRSGRTAAEELTMTPALRSADSSGPPSPTFLRANLTRTQSNLSTDERTPLLQSAGRSRIRVQSALESGKARLSRGHSFNNGKTSPQLHPRLCWD